MIKFLFLTIPNQYTYEQLKNPISFKQDIYGVTTWTMKHPLTILSSDLKMKHIFKHNEVKLQAITNPVLEQKWRYFVITKKDGGKYYCTSQIIYQKGLLRSSNLSQSQFFSTYQATNTLSGQQYYLPRCIVLISQLPYFKLQVNLLKIHKELKKQQPAISHCIEEDLYEMYLEYLETGRQKEWQGLNINEIKSKRRTYCPLELSFSYYVECCNNHQAGECIYIQKATSRQVLHLYKLYPSSLYQIGYFFHLPLSATSLRKIISGILTQKQIVFSSSNANLTVMVIETLMQMILPLKWCYMYAPNLPVELIQAAQESFMPYIVGISKQHLPLISKTNKIIVHIDTDEIETVFEQQQQQLRMLSKKFQKLLTWKSNSNKQYLQWQKQLRINSILLITTIFKKDLPLDKQHHHRKYQSQQQKLSQQKFYQQFLSKSMMYRKLIEDLHQKVYSQFYKLTKMDFTQRKNFLVNKFNSLHSQTIYPTKSDNKKQWIRYYEKYMRCKRRSRLNRHSLSMVENSLSGINSYPSLVPFYVSNVSGNSSIGVNGVNNGGSRFNGSVVIGNFGNNNNNVNTIGSGYFNANINNNNTNNVNLNNSANINNPTNPTDSTYPTNPNTPSTTTTTHQHQQPLPTHKPQFFSSRNNQLYQSSVSTGSYSNGLKFHLGMGRNSSKDIFHNNNGSSKKLRKESMAMSSIHYQGVDQQNGKGKQGQQFTQQVHSLQFNTSVNNLNNIQPMSQQQQESFSSRQYQYSTINPTSMNNNNNLNNAQPLNNNPTLSTNPNPNQQPPLINNNNILRTSCINSIQNNFIKSTNTNNNNNFMPTLSRVNEGSFEYSSSTITGNNQSNSMNNNIMNNNNYINNTTNNGSSQLNYNNNNMMIINNNIQYQNNNPYMFGNNNINSNNNINNNNTQNINNNDYFINNKINHNSMIFTNQPNIQQSQHPLNQSMVASFIFTNNQNTSTISPINTSSHRNLPSTQSTIVL